MKVLLCIRGDYDKNFGGDSMQVIKMGKYLRKLGVDVDINNGGITDYSKYDIVHLFNLSRMGETYKYYKTAHFYKKNIVISPIYWNLNKYYNYRGENENIKLWEKCNVYRNIILKGCKRVYPSSNLEAEALKKDFGEAVPCITIYNGVEIENEELPLYNFMARYNLDNYVLCVGRISLRKNQLSLVKACNKLGIQIVLIGKIKNKLYYEECIKYNNVKYLGFLDSYNIYNAYKFAKVHALTSFVETTGFSSLEAAASGCNVISTEEGSAREYFGNMAFYCNPYDERDIEEAVEKGFKKGKSQNLKNYVKERYDWEKSVLELYNDYVKILDSK